MGQRINIKFESGHSPLVVRLNNEYGMIGFGEMKSTGSYAIMHAWENQNNEERNLAVFSDLIPFLLVKGQNTSDVKKFDISDSTFYEAWGFNQILNWDSLEQKVDTVENK